LRSFSSCPIEDTFEGGGGGGGGGGAASRSIPATKLERLLPIAGVTQVRQSISQHRNAESPRGRARPPRPIAAPAHMRSQCPGNKAHVTRANNSRFATMYRLQFARADFFLIHKKLTLAVNHASSVLRSRSETTPIQLFTHPRRSNHMGAVCAKRGVSKLVASRLPLRSTISCAVAEITESGHRRRGSVGPV